MPNLEIPDMGLIDDTTRPLADQLNQKSENLNQTFKDIEQKLADLGFGFEVWLDQNDSDDLWKEFRTEDRNDRVIKIKTKVILGFGKHEKWCLLVREDTYECDQKEADWKLVDQSSPKPLLQCPRWFRIEAAKKLKRLVEVINEEIKKATNAMDSSEAINQSL